jgi:hypothetical protein
MGCRLSPTEGTPMDGGCSSLADSASCLLLEDALSTDSEETSCSNSTLRSRLFQDYLRFSLSLLEDSNSCSSSSSSSSLRLMLTYELSSEALRSEWDSSSLTLPLESCVEGFLLLWCDLARYLSLKHLIISVLRLYCWASCRRSPLARLKPFHSCLRVCTTSFIWWSIHFSMRSRSLAHASSRTTHSSSRYNSRSLRSTR